MSHTHLAKSADEAYLIRAMLREYNVRCNVVHTSDADDWLVAVLQKDADALQKVIGETLTSTGVRIIEHSQNDTHPKTGRIRQMPKDHADVPGRHASDHSAVYRAVFAMPDTDCIVVDKLTRGQAKAIRDYLKPKGYRVRRRVDTVENRYEVGRDGRYRRVRKDEYTCVITRLDK